METIYVSPFQKKKTFPLIPFYYVDVKKNLFHFYQRKFYYFKIIWSAFKFHPLNFILWISSFEFHPFFGKKKFLLRYRGEFSTNSLALFFIVSHSRPPGYQTYCFEQTNKGKKKKQKKKKEEREETNETNKQPKKIK